MGEEAAGKPPVVILAEETNVTSGTAVQEKLITAAQVFGNLLRSTYGPRGLDKMLYKTNGMTAVTNDGAKIVAELMVKHPAAKMFVAMAEGQENACGDGVTGTLLLCTELLIEAGRLLEKGLHPLTVIEGHSRATEVALATIDSLAMPVDENTATQIALTAMTGKGAEGAGEHLAALVAEALSIVEDGAEDVSMFKVGSGALSDSHLVRGVVLRRRILLDALPTTLQNPKVAAIHGDIAPRKQIRTAEIEIEGVEQLESFLAAEDEIRDGLAKNLLDTGATVFLCTGKVDKGLLHRLMRAGCFAAGELDDSELRNTAAATGARIVELLTDISSTDLGTAGQLITERRTATSQVEDLIRLIDCPSPKMATFEIGGASNIAAEEAIRAIHDALRATHLALEDGRIIHGGGATHMACALAIREAAEHEPGRERLAMESFARAMEIIPANLARNAGTDPLDRILELRAAHRQGQTSTGITALGEVGPTGAMEGARCLESALDAANETCASMLRIDQVVSARGD
jgi:chaperonin GroEL (HSP60 family)